MIYAVCIRKTESAITDNDPTIYAFATQEAHDAMQDAFWQGSRFEGWNLVPVTFGTVQSYNGLKIMYQVTDKPDTYIVAPFRSSDDEWWQYNEEYYKSEGLPVPQYVSAAEAEGLQVA